MFEDKLIGLFFDCEFGCFVFKDWYCEEGCGGGGCMLVMIGCVFEKVGVYILIVYGEFLFEFCLIIFGVEEDFCFWVFGILFIVYFVNFNVFIVYMNICMVVIILYWFGGGVDFMFVFDWCCM